MNQKDIEAIQILVQELQNYFESKNISLENQNAPGPLVRIMQSAANVIAGHQQGDSWKDFVEESLHTCLENFESLSDEMVAHPLLKEDKKAVQTRCGQYNARMQAIYNNIQKKTMKKNKA